MVGWETLQRHYLNLTAPDGQSMNFGWQRCKKEFYKKVPKVCVMCNNKKSVELHHKLPRHIRPDLAVDMTNLIALCKSCHLRSGHGGSYFKYNETIELVAFYCRQISVIKDNKKDEAA